MLGLIVVMLLFDVLLKIDVCHNLYNKTLDLHLSEFSCADKKETTTGAQAGGPLDTQESVAHSFHLCLLRIALFVVEVVAGHITPYGEANDHFSLSLIDMI